MRSGIGRVWRNITFMLVQCFRADPPFIFVCLAVHALSLITPLTGSLGIKFIIDSLTGGAPYSRIVLTVAVYCALNVSKGLADSWYDNSFLPSAKLKISRCLDLRLMQRTVSLDLAVFDDAGFFDKYTRAKNEITGRAVSVVTTLCEMIGCLFSLAALTAVIAAIEPFVLICVCAGVVLSFGLDMLRSKLWYRFDLEVTPVSRRIDYIRRIFYEPQYMTELRLFGLRGLGERKYTAYTGELGGILKRQGRAKTAVSGLSVLLDSGLFNGCAMLYLGWRVFTGALGIGDFSAMFSAVFSFGGELYSFIGKFPELYSHSLYIDNLREVTDRRENIERGGTLKLDPSALHRIELRDVSFSYGNGAAALEHVSMVMEKGWKTAIVGYNGAGKSTLIKLICRLYDPDEGEILIDGVNIREYDTKSLRAAFGIVMQNFHHYSFTIAENICPSDPEHHTAQILDAIVASDLSERVSRLPAGIDSPLTREFDSSGVVLSGGEFQKLSLARAVVSDPSTLILDEVTSALDPIAEERLNDTLVRNARDRSVIIISHRLNFTRDADMIYMFEHGRIVESGTHAALMEKRGRYAEFYSAQARHYA